MKRSLFAPVAALVLVAAIAGPVAAKALPPVDQSNAIATSPNITYASTLDLAQTFTVGKPGLLIGVNLWLEHLDGMWVNVEGVAAGIPNGTVVAASSESFPTNTAGWVFFAFTTPLPVNVGDQYALVFNTASGADAAYGSGNTYAGGRAFQLLGGVWGTVTGQPLMLDFGFQTIVDPQTTTLSWDKTQITAGTTSALTLTETILYPSYSVAVDVRPASPAFWEVKSDTLPAWFTVTGLTCSMQVATADCILANIATGASLPLIPNGHPVVLTLTGTAAPSTAGSATGKAESCAEYPIATFTVIASEAQAQPAEDTYLVCVSSEAAISVVAAAATSAPSHAVTLPPTSTGRSSSNPGPGSALWLLPASLILGACGALFLSRRHASIR